MVVALLYILFAFSFPSLSVFAFPSTFGSASQCRDVTVEWTGGTGPYSLLIMPAFGTPTNISIPASAYADGKGSYSTPLTLAEGKKVVLTMSDATGFGAGGSSEILTVASGTAGCNLTDPGVDFYYTTDTPLRQCRSYVFADYPAATLPITVWAIVPGGTSRVLQAGATATSFSWTANVAAGTSMLFVVTDARGRQGGVSDIQLVGATDDATCLNNGALSSTARPTPTTSTQTTPSETTSPAPTESSLAAAPGVPISAIAGTVIGSLLFLAVLVTLGLHFLNMVNARKLEASKGGELGRAPSNGNFFGNSGNPGPSYYPQTPHTAATLDNPFSDSSAELHSPYRDPRGVYAQTQDPFLRPSYPPSPLVPASQNPFNSDSSTHLAGGGSESNLSKPSATSKAALAGVSDYPPSRYVVHRDIEDMLPPPNDDGVVELPPQYVERPGPSRQFSIRNPSPAHPNVQAPPSTSPQPPCSNMAPFT